jgi:hypothetical protein
MVREAERAWQSIMVGTGLMVIASEYVSGIPRAVQLGRTCGLQARPPDVAHRGAGYVVLTT